MASRSGRVTKRTLPLLVVLLIGVLWAASSCGSPGPTTTLAVTSTVAVQITTTTTLPSTTSSSGLNPMGVTTTSAATSTTLSRLQIEQDREQQIKKWQDEIAKLDAGNQGGPMVYYGKMLFQTGKDSAGKALKFTGGTAAVQKAAVAACVTCHGTNAKGMTGLGPNISSTVMKSNYGTEWALSRALNEGISLKGVVLKTTMPRYVLPPRKVTALDIFTNTTLISTQPASEVEYLYMYLRTLR